LKIAAASPGRGDKAAGCKEGGGGSTAIGVTGVTVPLCWALTSRTCLGPGLAGPAGSEEGQEQA